MQRNDPEPESEFLREREKVVKEMLHQKSSPTIVSMLGVVIPQTTIQEIESTAPPEIVARRDAAEVLSAKRQKQFKEELKQAKKETHEVVSKKETVASAPRQETAEDVAKQKESREAMQPVAQSNQRPSTKPPPNRAPKAIAKVLTTMDLHQDDLANAFQRHGLEVIEGKLVELALSIGGHDNIFLVADTAAPPLAVRFMTLAFGGFVTDVDAVRSAIQSKAGGPKHWLTILPKATRQLVSQKNFSGSTQMSST